jgi:hypothetical protein
MNRASAASLSVAAQTQTVTVANNDPPIAGALFSLSGTYGTAVVIFQGQLYSGGNWVNLGAALIESPYTLVSGNISPSDNSDYIYKVFSPEGLYAIRCKLVSIVSGAVVVNCTTLTPKDMVTQLLPVSIQQATTGQAITSTSATALAVGANGTTNPVFSVNANTASVATGLTIIGAAAASGVAMTVISSGTNENLTINAKGSGTITMNNSGTGNTVFAQGFTMADAKDMAFNTTTGTKIGTATTQKLSIYGKTPVVQPAANTDTTTGAAGSVTSVFLNTTFTGGGTAAYTVGGVVAALKAVGILAV